MKLLSIGYGAGGRDLPIPNVMRVLIGEQAESSIQATLETLALLETNVDDLNPQIYDYLMNRLFQSGALDVFLQPVQMKKNRPGILVSVLCPSPKADELCAILFAETSTLGIRKQTVERQALQRFVQVMETPFGRARVKFARLNPKNIKFAPEYEDCRALAEQHGVPLREVYRAVERAVEQVANPDG